MTPMLHIRKSLLGIRQVEMAALTGVSQGTVSRWETGELEPSRAELAAIRNEARRRGLRWNDKVFFEAPATQAPSTEASAA